MDLRLAWRNLARHRWRTFLTMGGVAVAVAMLVWSTALLEAFIAMMVNAAIGAQLADIDVRDQRSIEEPLLEYALDVDDALLADIRALPGVVEAGRRIESFGLVGQEKRSVAALLLGVDPASEKRIAAGVKTGRWLAAERGKEREVVLGAGLAKQLEVSLGDELVLIVQATDGSLGNELLRVVGVAKTGSSMLDRQAAFLEAGALAETLVLEGKAHQVVVRLARGEDLDERAAAVRKVVQGRTGESVATVRTWKQVMPDLHQMVTLSEKSMWFIYVILYFLAGLGILNAQRMSALERKREFGVMVAIGMTPGRLGGIVVQETVLLSLLGGIAGALLGAAMSLWNTKRGFDFGMFSSGEVQDFSYMGIAFDTLVYFDFHPSMIVAPLFVVVAVGVVCGLWPAAASARLQPVQAISGRT